MKPQLIWDWPTRLFHIVLASGFVAAFVISNVGEHSTSFAYHSIIGLALGAALILRIAWGVIGTKYARFTSFIVAPTSLVRYLKGMLSGKDAHYAGHNPANSVASILMFLLLAGIITTGVLMGRGNESLKEVHELCTYGLIAVASVHVIGVLLHMARHREKIALGMVTGLKRAEDGEAIRTSAPVAGLAFVVAVGLFAVSMVKNFDAVRMETKLPLVGTSIVLGEAEGVEGESRQTRRREKDDD